MLRSRCRRIVHCVRLLIWKAKLVKWETVGSDLSLPPNQSEGLGSFALTTIRKKFVRELVTRALYLLYLYVF